MISLLRALTGALFMALVMWGSTCAAANDIRVLATTYPVYLLTSEVTRACPGVYVDLLIPAQTGCPHEYALSPRDMRKLAAARIMVINGLGMETFMDHALANLKNVTIIDSSANVTPLQGAHHHGHSEHHSHGVNAHAFTSPVQAAAMVRTIGKGLAKAAPHVAGTCLKAAEAYALRLEALGRRMAALGARTNNKDVVLLHDGMAYFVRDAGLHLAAVIQEDEDVQPSAARLLEVTRQCKEHRPALLIGEPQYSEKPLRALTAETAIPVVLLDSAASGPENPPSGYYEHVMEKNCQLLEEHLGNN